MPLQETGQCKGCDFSCKYKPVERRALAGRNYCIRAVQNGRAGEMTSAGFKPWRQILKESGINLTGFSIMHVPRQ